ncbi:MAG: hypothetical protein P4M12_10685 [Gammaproteobacteria bacterium]|nr:hypothetical protein [Gammaproteobacteria bacterium]
MNSKHARAASNLAMLGQYHRFESKLKKQGVKKSMEDDVICRWHYDDIILDVMPTNEKILGFGNRWYMDAIEHAMTHQIVDDLFIKSVTAPYFLATKIGKKRVRPNTFSFYVLINKMWLRIWEKALLM